MKRILNLLVLLMAMMPVMAETVLFEGSTTVEYGSVSVNIDGSLFADAVAGDIVTVEGEKLDAEVANWWWQMTININNPWTTIAQMGDDGLPVTYTLTADDITKIQGSGLQIQGHGDKSYFDICHIWRNRRADHLRGCRSVCCRHAIRLGRLWWLSKYRRE